MLSTVLSHCDWQLRADTSSWGLQAAWLELTFPSVPPFLALAPGKPVWVIHNVIRQRAGQQRPVGVPSLSGFHLTAAPEEKKGDSGAVWGRDSRGGVLGLGFSLTSVL